MSAFGTTTQHRITGFSQGNQARKRNKDIQIRKEVKLPLFADMMFYIGIPKESTK